MQDSILEHWDDVPSAADRQKLSEMEMPSGVKVEVYDGGLVRVMQNPNTSVASVWLTREDADALLPFLSEL